MHAFARLNGYGLAVVPRSPYRINREELGSDSIRVEHGDRLAKIHIPRDGSEPELEGDVAIIDVEDVEPQPGWVMETTPFSIPWPEGFTLQSGPPGGGPPGFDFFAGDGRLIYPQGPFAAGKVELEKLVEPGSTLTLRGTVGAADFVECAYQAEGRPWKLRHYLLRRQSTAEVLVLTAQAPAEHSEKVFATADLMVDGITF